jgi:3-hydroxybutyryl-CoA dehydratase
VEYLMEKYFDELNVGDRQVTRGRTITEADIVMWCALTGDWFVLHTDKTYAAKTMFGQRIAPGLMVHAFGAGLAVPPQADSVIANYGTERLRYPAPTFIGDTIHTEVEVVDKQVRDDETGIVDLKFDVINQNGVVVCSSIIKVLMRRRPSDT